MKNSKQHLYSLTCIEMTKSIQQNQVNNIHTNRNVKIDRKATKDMKSRSTRKKK